VFDAGEFVRESIMMFRFARRRVVVAASVAAVALFLPAQLGHSAQQQKLRIAAASDLQFAMADLSGQCEKQTGTATDITYGSSGNFFAQIQNGAPFDLFFSADIDYPEKLDAAGLTEPGSLNKYAVGRIVIWVPSESKIDVARQKWDSLLLAGVQRIAVANPQHAPYGRAAVEALKRAGMYDQVQSRLVYGENISQAAQFVQSGNAQVGIIALSLALSPAMKDGKRWGIPVEGYSAIEQGAVIIKNSQNKDAARKFLEFVKSDSGRAILARFGFAIPGGAEKSAL
jgi:molybdate transport system substrate-binding protein